MKKFILLVMLFAPLTMFAQKFGHVDVETVMKAMPEYTKATTELQALQKQYSDELKSMEDEITKKNDEYQKAEQTNPTMPDNIKKRHTEELQGMYQKYQQAQQDYATAFQKSQQEKLSVVQTKVMDAIKSIGQAGGFVYIMQSGSLPYISTTLSTDVTAQVKAKLGLK
jgi:outer membrane protein